MYNRIILIGRLTRDPELRYIPSGAPVASFTLAVDRPFKNQAGERETDFINVVAWRKLAEFTGQYLSKGRMIAVEGRLQIRPWETQDGQRRTSAEVVADAVRFLDRKPGGNGGATPADEHPAEPGEEPAHETVEAGADEDVPF